MDFGINHTMQYCVSGVLCAECVPLWQALHDLQRLHIYIGFDF